jgi:hypothetical protein
LLQWKREVEDRRVLVMDIETHNTNFLDPKWTTYEVMAIGCSWLGSGEVHSCVMPESETALMEWYAPFHEKADMLVGHNVPQFDMIGIQGARFRSQLKPFGPKLIHDTYQHRLKTRGVSKSLANTAYWLGITEAVKGQPDWKKSWSLYTPHEEIRRDVDPYVRGDVALSDVVYRTMRERGWLKEPKMWQP